jgi:hypothetical protein
MFLNYPSLSLSKFRLKYAPKFEHVVHIYGTARFRNLNVVGLQNLDMSTHREDLQLIQVVKRPISFQRVLIQVERKGKGRGKRKEKIRNMRKENKLFVFYKL